MKKIVSLVVCVALMLGLSGCILEEVSLLYDETVQADGWLICINRKANCCFVGSFECATYAENMQLVIPDEYDGIPIKRLGGYLGRGVPTPFNVSLLEKEDCQYIGGDPASFAQSDRYTVEDVVFRLHIGKNVEKVEFVGMLDHYYQQQNTDGSETFYRVAFDVECDEANRFFYSKDGKLYDKKTDELVTALPYKS